MLKTVVSAGRGALWASCGQSIKRIQIRKCFIQDLKLASPPCKWLIISRTMSDKPFKCCYHNLWHMQCGSCIYMYYELDLLHKHKQQFILTIKPFNNYALCPLLFAPPQYGSNETLSSNHCANCNIQERSRRLPGFNSLSYYRSEIPWYDLKVLKSGLPVLLGS